MEMLSSIIGIAMLAVAMYHAIGIFRIFLRNSKQVAAVEGHIEVQCEKCGRHYQVTPEEFNRKKTTKAKSVTTPGKGPVPGSIANVKHSSYYVKKFLCPHCGTEQWASVVDIGRLQQKAYDKIFNSLNPLYWYRHKDEIRLADQIWYHIIVIILVMNLCGAVLN